MQARLKRWLNTYRRLVAISITIWFFAIVCKIAFFISHQQFDPDSVRDYMFISQHLQERNYYIPLGPAAASYSDFSVLPGYYYLQLLAQMVSGGYFYAIVWAIMLLESFTPVLLYWYLRKLWPEASWLLLLPVLSWCMAPMVMSASTASWNPNLIPLVSMIFLVSSHVWLFERRSIGLFGVIFSFLCFVNLHFQWFILLPAGIWCMAMVICRWRQSWKTLLLGLFLSLLLLSPYLHFELTHNFVNLRAALHFVGQGNTTERLRKPIFWTYFFPGFYTRAFTGRLLLLDWQQLYENQDKTIRSPIMIVAVIVWWMTTIAYFAGCWHQWQRGEKLQAIKLCWPLIIWGSAAISLRLFYKGDKPDYFLYCLLPVGWVFCWGVLLSWRDCWWSRLAMIVIIGVEILSLNQIPKVKARNDYHEFINIMNSIPESKRTLVILNQNLLVPLEYFMPSVRIKRWPDASASCNILLCDPSQHCDWYKPESTNAAVNYYKYDLVTPVNYSFVYPHYQATMSASGYNTSLAWRIICQGL